MIQPGLITVLFLLLACTAGADNREAKTLRLGLDQAIDLMIDRSIIVQNASLERASGKFAYQVARDEYRPRLSVSSGSTTNSLVTDDDRSHSRDLGISTQLSLKLPTGGTVSMVSNSNGSFTDQNADYYASDLSLRLSQPLLNGGGIKVGRAPLVFARRSREIGFLSFRRELMNAVTEIVKSYRAYQLTRQSLDISRLSLERSQRQLAMNRELVQAGRLAAVELIQGEADVANQELDYRSAENEAEIARLNFLQRLHLDLEQELELTTPLQPLEPVNLDLERAVATAKANQPDYLQGVIAVANAELSHELGKNSQLWDLSLNVNYGLAGDGNSYARSFHDFNRLTQGNASVSLDLTIPIGDKARKQQVIDSQINLIQQKNQFNEQNFSLKTELLTQIQSIQILWQQVELSRRSLELTRRQLALEQEKLASGRTTSFQVVSFQNDLITAENRFAAIRVSYLNSLTDLNSTMGTTLDVWQIDVNRLDNAATVSQISRYSMEDL